jgi:glycosyltransferase involved in cell wall biosynthesis
MKAAALSGGYHRAPVLDTARPAGALSQAAPTRQEQADANPISVLLVTPRWARDGGVGAHVEASASELALAGHRVTVVAARIESPTRLAGVTLMRNPKLCRPEASLEERLGDVPAGRPDVVHLHQIDDPGIAQRMRDIAPVVISAHGYTACTSGVHYYRRPGQESRRAHGPGCVPNLLFRGCAHVRNPLRLPAMYRHATRGLHALTIADHAVSYSTAVDCHLADNGIERRSIVPYFPTLGAAVPDGGRDEHDGRVLFAGRIVPPKGLAVLIRAAREVDARFIVCGDGPQREAMQRLAARLGVADRFSFAGWLGADEFARELARSSFAVVPSLWPEPFGLVGIEAFAAGRPAVASATGGIGDWLQDGVSGLLVPPGNPRALARALNELLADPERRDRMGAAGMRVVQQRFSPQRHLGALLECYRAARARWESARS